MTTRKPESQKAGQVKAEESAPKHVTGRFSTSEGEQRARTAHDNQSAPLSSLLSAFKVRALSA